MVFLFVCLFSLSFLSFDSLSFSVMEPLLRLNEREKGEDESVLRGTLDKKKRKIESKRMK